MFAYPMSRLSLVVALAVALTPTVDAAPGKATRDRLTVVELGRESVLGSTGTGASFKAADPDTFYLYGGPGSLLGKYQQSFGPGAAPDLQGWTSRDVTQNPPLWQPSTFMSPTGTTAMWAGQTAEQQPGWYAAPGYGNNWNALLEYRVPVSSPATGQTVDLEFIFNHDTEPGYDFFWVEYDSAEVVKPVFRIDGYNQEPWLGPAIPLNYPDDVSTLGEIVYAGGDYNGSGGDEIVIRLRVTSDGAWSNQDGLWPSLGAAQVDDIRVTHLDGMDFEDFEGAPGQFLWKPLVAPFAGNYADIYSRITDLDPCLENSTPVIGFIDHPNPYQPGDVSAVGDVDDYLPKNPAWDGAPTQGSLRDGYGPFFPPYGIAGDWVLNFTGGVSAGVETLDNEWWSPVIAWDDPTTTGDDAVQVAGVRIRASVWRHLPLSDGIFFQWAVRGRDAGNQSWGAWQNRNFVYEGSDPKWVNLDVDVSDLLPQGKDAVQIQWAARDLGQLFGFGSNGTPSPCIDNATVLKYRLQGPVIAARSVDLFQDSFAQSGATGAELSSSAQRETHGVRLDMARDVNSGWQAPITPGDSIVVDVTSVIPGVAISDSLNQIRLHFALNRNPVFEPAIRGNLSTTTTSASASGGMYGWDQTVGTVAARQAYSADGQAAADRYFFDFPDDHFLYPGDVLEYYIEAVDDDGNTSTLPKDLTGFDDDDASTPLPYSRSFTVRALPSYQNTAGDQPATLLWNDFGHRGGEAEWNVALRELGLIEGIQYDSYTTMAPSSFASNGLGSSGAHGASSAQLDGYDCILYEGGDLSSGLISAGTNQVGNDKGDDAGVLLSWWNTAGADRNMAHWSNHLVDMLHFAGNSTTYLNTILNATHVSRDVRPSIGNQATPRILPTGFVGGINEEFLANGGCQSVPVSRYAVFSGLSVLQFDQITPGSGAVASHGFEDSASPGSIYDPDNVAAAGIFNMTTDGSGGVKKSFLFPYGLLYIASPQNKLDPGNPTVRTILLAEVLNVLDPNHLIGGETPAPSAPSLRVHGNVPNPFNPATELQFTLGQSGRGAVKVYNLRGELVRTVAAGEFPAGLNRVEWRGRDEQGAEVASGVYFVRYEIAGLSESQKIVLLK